MYSKYSWVIPLKDKKGQKKPQKKQQQKKKGTKNFEKI